MALPDKTQTEKFSYADYLSWPDEERWEIIDGDVFDMSPAPSPVHQEILVNLVFCFKDYLKDKPCKVYPAPFDVRLADGPHREKDIINVVQPDISIICKKSKIDDKGCLGAPDLIVEILSPSTSEKDLNIKFNLYEKYKVKEYWIVHPNDKTVLVYKLKRGKKYERPGTYSQQGKIKVGIFSDLEIDCRQIFN